MNRRLHLQIDWGQEESRFSRRCDSSRYRRSQQRKGTCATDEPRQPGENPGGIEQIGKAITHMGRATAAGAKQSAAGRRAHRPVQNPAEIVGSLAAMAGSEA